MNRQTTIIIGLIGVIILLLWFHGCEAKNFKEQISMLEAANDTLVKKRNEDGSQKATIQLLQADKVKDLLKLKSNDETIKQLQAEVKANKRKIQDGGSVTIFTTTTSYSAVANTSVEPNGDSCNPIYLSSKRDEWVKWSTIANSINTTLDLKVTNAYSVIIGREKVGFMKYKPIVEVVNKNPYSDITSLRAFEIKETKRRWTIGVQATIGLNVMTMKPGLVVGVGTSYKLLEL